MRQIPWDALGPLPAQALYMGAILCVWTIVGMFVMKYFARRVPLLNHATILFWATLRVQIVAFGLIHLGSVFGISVRSLSSLLGLLASCAVGWLVTRDLSRKYGTPTKFPAVGAKVVTTMIIITLLIIVAIIVMTGA